MRRSQVHYLTSDDTGEPSLLVEGARMTVCRCGCGAWFLAARARRWCCDACRKAAQRVSVPARVKSGQTESEVCDG